MRILKPRAEAAYQLATEIAGLTTCCDPEIIYWFSRLISLMDVQPTEIDCDQPAGKLPSFGMADLCSKRRATNHFSTMLAEVIFQVCMFH